MFDIVTPTFNNEAYTVNCFKSIKRNSKDYHIIWVDNGSTKESRDKVSAELATHDPSTYTTVWLDKNYGFVVATNKGIEAGKSDFVILLNNDTTVTPNWIPTLHHPFTVDHTIAATGPLTDAIGSWQGWRNVKQTILKDLPDLTGMNETQILEALKNKYQTKYFYAPMIAFFCTMFKRKIFQDLGILDTCFAMGLGDDDDMCMRIRKAGFKVACVPASFIYHHHRTTFKSLYNEKEIRQMQFTNIKKYNEKHKIK